MEIQLLKEEREAAAAKWREYKDATKKTRDPLYNDLKKVYNQVKNGKAVIDIFQAIQGGSIHADTCHPKLAVARANIKEVYCEYNRDGSIRFRNQRWKDRAGDVALTNCLPKISTWLSLCAPVPIIPPRLRPKKLTDDYYILWEVDSWTPTPSRDPYLLKRITSNLFVVCAAWDLTDIEMRVMAGRIIS